MKWRRLSWAMRGAAVGTAILVPGLSGGSVAVVLGVYRPLVLVWVLGRPRPGQAVPLGLGVVGGVAAGSRIIALALVRAPDQLGAPAGGRDRAAVEPEDQPATASPGAGTDTRQAPQVRREGPAVRVKGEGEA